ncbi:unnamed protein product [Caenorhabditis angaria]|uniref:UPAR/Ly6 domain-containing protein n=1 Tax=Caenorhabditis angaria TaxID=860376 RepID=A0A9P1IY25_9PELO|nr:unnamed protein product [Caenorhabditis angaria]
MCRIFSIFSFLTFVGFSLAAVRCYKGFSGDGRAFKDRLCTTDFCLKTTERDGGAYYGCDDFTPFCTRDECVTTSRNAEVCCCSTALCNASIKFWNPTTISLILSLLISYFFWN